MGTNRDERLATTVTELAAEYVNLESNRNSLITITRTDILNRGKHAIVYFSVLPESEEKTALNFLSRHTGKLRAFITSKKIMGFPPQIKFMIDLGEKNRQRIDELSREA